MSAPRTLTAAVAALVLGSAFACTSLQPRSSNRAACERYVAHMNALEPCLGVRYEASNLCQEVDRTTVDMADWYTCLLENSACDGTRAKLEVDGCKPPVIDLAAAAAAERDPG